MNATTGGAIRINIEGMTCGHCVQAVTKALSGVPGVTVRSVEVGAAVIDALDKAVQRDALAALDSAGYPAMVKRDSSSNASPGLASGGGGCCGGCCH